MKKLLILSLILSILVIGGIKTNASVVTDEILSLMPGITIEELNQSIKETALSSGKSEDEVSVQILSELKVQEDLTKEERASLTTRSSSGGSSSSTYTLGSAKYNGDIFYEPASTFSVQHGHVGMYWTSDVVVESMPDDGTINGVRSVNRTNKKVESGSKIFTLSGVSASTQNDASNWAYSRIGDKYSYNFVTNRSTSHYGDKNCSKLVWSSYMLKADLDLDSDGGLGVYPKDILRHSKSSIYTSY